MRRVASFLCVLGLVASCSVFDASMRGDANDAGTSSSGNAPGGDASDDRSTAKPVVDDGSIGGDDGAAAAEPTYNGSDCVGWVLQDGTGASGCSDPEYTLATAALEQERNDTDAEATMLPRGKSMCGIVKAGRVDIFAFDVPAGGCFHIDVDSDFDLALDIEVKGPGIGFRTIPNNKRLELPGKADSAGRVYIALRTPRAQGDLDVTYKLAVR